MPLLFPLTSLLPLPRLPPSSPTFLPFFPISPSPSISIYKETLPAPLLPSSLISVLHLAFFSLSCLPPSSMPAAIMHAHHPFIHADVLFIKASIIQPTPWHLSSLRPRSHPPSPPPPPSTHGTSPEASTLPVAPLFSFLLSCLCTSYTCSLLQNQNPSSETDNCSAITYCDFWADYSFKQCWRVKPFECGWNAECETIWIQCSKCI